MLDTSNLGSQTDTSPQVGATQLLEGLKVFVVVVLVLGGQGAVLAYNSVLDWSKINDAGTLLHLVITAWNGFQAGLINGAARSVQVVMAIWAGPTVWKYAAPVLGATAAVVSQVMTSFAAMFRRSTPPKSN